MFLGQLRMKPSLGRLEPARRRVSCAEAQSHNPGDPILRMAASHHGRVY